MPLTSPLPDIAETKINNDMYPLQWVGMEGIAIPLSVTLSTNQLQTVTASANVYVGLDDTSKKGIHMSRLHALLNEFSLSNCNKKNLERLLTNMVSSQSGISQSARIELSFDILLPKKLKYSTLFYTIGDYIIIFVQNFRISQILKRLGLPKSSRRLK